MGELILQLLCGLLGCFFCGFGAVFSIPHWSFPPSVPPQVMPGASRWAVVEGGLFFEGADSRPGCVASGHTMGGVQ